MICIRQREIHYRNVVKIDFFVKRKRDSLLLQKIMILS